MSAYVYRCYDALDRLLYVGVTIAGAEAEVAAILGGFVLTNEDVA